MQAGELFGAIPVVTYEWDGAQHASSTTKRDGGEVVARNTFVDPSFMNDDTEILHPRLALEYKVDHDAPVGGRVVSFVQDTLGTFTYASIRGTARQDDLEAGRHTVVAVHLRVSPGARITARYGFLGASGWQYSWAGHAATEGEWQRLTFNAAQLPADTTTSMMVNFYLNDGSSETSQPPQGAWFELGDMHVAIAETKAAALDQVEDFFSGDTPNVYRYADPTVREYTSRVVVDGVPRPHASWDLEREIPGGVTPQVVSGSGIMQTTGTIMWSDESAIKASGDNPWNPTSWWPDEGQQVEIYVSDGVTEWKQFTGVIDETIGDIGDPVIQSRIIDRFDDLSVKISHDPLLRQMPPAQQGGTYRYCDLVPSYYLDYAFRAAGWAATPRRELNTALLVPMMGGSWPHVGRLDSAVDFTNSSTTPLNRRTPWGFGIGDARLAYALNVIRPASSPLQITIMVGPDHNDSCSISVETSTGQLITMTVTSDRSVWARTNAGGTTQTACLLSVAQMRDATVVTMLVKGSQFSLRNDVGHESSGTGAAASGNTERTIVTAWPDAVIGGLMVNYPDQPYLEHRPSIQWGNPTGAYRKRAYIDTSNISHLSVITAAPAIVSRTAASVIEEISEALLGAAWIDEHGNMHWSTGQAMRTRPVVDAVTTAEHVTGLSVNKSLLGSRSLVTVEYQFPSISYSRYQMIEVWRGNTKTLTANDHVEDIISPPGDEEWVMVDTGYTRVGPYNATAYNRKRGSFMGFTYTQDGDYYAPGGINDVTTFQKIGPDAWKLTHTVPYLPADVQAQTRTPDDEENGTNYYSWNRNNSLPLVQAGARVQWQDEEVTPTGVFGVGPQLVHDAGPWAAFNIAENIGSYLQSQTERPLPTITGIEVIADPRRQLADMIRIDSPGLMGVRVRAFVNKVSTGFDANGLTQSLGLTTVSATTRWQTYEQFNDAGGALSYQQWNTLSPRPTDYEAFNTAATGDR